MRQASVCTNRVFVVSFMQAQGKCAMKRRWRRRKQRCTLNNNFIERKDFIRHYQRNGWMDLSKLWVIYSLHIKGTNTLVMGSLG